MKVKKKEMEKTTMNLSKVALGVFRDYKLSKTESDEETLQRIINFVDNHKDEFRKFVLEGVEKHTQFGKVK